MNELDTTKNLTKISNKDGIWFSEHSLETVKWDDLIRLINNL